MKQTYTEYVELIAPQSVVAHCLQDEHTWALLPLPEGVTRYGDLWRLGADLYHITCETMVDTTQHHADDADDADDGSLLPPLSIRWIVTPAIACGVQYTITATLYDAVVATHMMVQCEWCGKTRQNSVWQQWLIQRRVKPLLRHSIRLLETHVQEEHTSSITPQESQEQPASDHPLVNTLWHRYPRTVAHFVAMNATDHLERIWLLEKGWQRIIRGEYDASVYAVCDELPLPPHRGTNRFAPDAQPLPQQTTHAAAPLPTLDYDIIYAGGGLGLVHAAVMACCYGKRVMVFDRGEVGTAHREWNISREELQVLVDMRVATWAELDTVIMREYRTGLVSFFAGHSRVAPQSELWLPSVLSLAIDATGLLRLMRQKVVQHGGVILDNRHFKCVHVCNQQPLFVTVELERADWQREAALLAVPSMSSDHAEEPTERYTAQLLLDGMGTTSPLTLLRYARRPFAGICPTVGTTVGGFAQGTRPREYDPSIGDILISIADTQHHRQLIWEGFPGKDDEMTVYVFYYAVLNGVNHPPDATHEAPYSLFELFEQYFMLLHTYKKAGRHFRQMKPLYGYIPARHNLRPNEARLLRGVLPIGDSAALQSPLTFCGFGSHIRNLQRTTSLLNYAMKQHLMEPEHLKYINAFQVNVSLNWVFSRFMQPWAHPHTVNELQNIFLRSLNDLGIPLAMRFFQDRTRWHDYNRILGTVLLHYPVIILQAWRVLTLSGIVQWIKNYVRFTVDAGIATGARVAGSRVEHALYHVSEHISPEVAFPIRAKYAEWRAMQWLNQQIQNDN